MMTRRLEKRMSIREGVLRKCNQVQLPRKRDQVWLAQMDGLACLVNPGTLVGAPQLAHEPASKQALGRAIGEICRIQFSHNNR